jgi:uncharacterized protein (TIGR04255 family)
VPSNDSDGMELLKLGRILTPIRPKFEKPPLIERALAISFSKLEAFNLGDYGLFWSQIRDEFPLSEVASPVRAEIESYDGFKPIQPKIELMPDTTLPRAFFRNPEKGELIQLQPDRFGFNWIKNGADHQYPHSEAVLTEFFSLLDKLIAFADERNFGEIVPVQCELTNVNVVPISDVGENFVDIATVIRMADIDLQYGCVRLESQLAGSKHLIIDGEGKPIGRVHSIAQPAIQPETGELAFRFDIVARGMPLGSGVSGIKAFLDHATSAVNAVFLASVTNAGRQFWGEING